MSLLPCLVEEAWEVYEAVRSGHAHEDLEEEIGDLLYTALFMAMRGEALGRLSLARMLRRTREKMIRRHPHVFGKQAARTASEAYKSWQRVKRSEGRKKRGPTKQFSRALVQSWELLLKQRPRR
jgi:uncharacterized protein YabN with tetrapyrrole methylase and pyrophosphatase domain